MLRSRILFSHTLLAAFAAAVILAGAGCGPDPQVQALQQENAALRKQAAGQAPPDASNSGSPSRFGPNGEPLDSKAPTSAPTGTPSAPPVKVTTAGGTPPVQTDICMAKLGVPTYPNAKLSKQAGASDRSVLSGGGVEIIILETTDKVEQVAAFYDAKMTASNLDMQAGVPKHPNVYSKTQDNLKVVTLTDMRPGGDMRLIKVHEDVGRTYIELMSLKSQQIPASALPPGVSRSPQKPAGSGAGANSSSTNPSGTGTSTAAPAGSDPLKPTLLPPGSGN